MRILILLSSVLVLLSSAVYLSMGHNEVEAQARVKPGGGVAVLELFTSEGCSSCPAADNLLEELYKIYRGKDLPVYPLAFHVDYWNYLGWNDDYSNPAFTKRQYAYGEKFALSSVYTPQLVVNGKEEFVGSSRARAVEAISKVLSEGSEVNVTLDVIHKDRTIDVVVQLDKVPAGSVVVIAVAERDIRREIHGGENAGITMGHENIVRAFEIIAASTSIRKTLTLPQDLKPASSSVVAFVQNKATLSIVGASSKDIILP